MNIAFIVGAARSGTSILGELVAAHPDVNYIFEVHSIWELAGEGIDNSHRLNETHSTPLFTEISAKSGVATTVSPHAQRGTVCIAGMHRSGTSLVARLLNLTGVYLGPEERMIPPKPDNPTGFWENLDFVHLNDQILTK